MGVVKDSRCRLLHAARSLFEVVLRRNNKNFFDQSLDEIKLLKFLNLQVVRSPSCTHTRAHTCTDTSVHARALVRTHQRTRTRAHAHTYPRARARARTHPLPPQPTAAGSAWRVCLSAAGSGRAQPHHPSLRLLLLQGNRRLPSCPASPAIAATVPAARAHSPHAGTFPRAHDAPALQEHLFIVCELMHENL